MLSTSNPTEITRPAGAPAWITTDLIASTILTWQPYYNEPLTSEVVLEILLSVDRLIELLESTDGETVSGPGTGLFP